MDTTEQTWRWAKNHKGGKCKRWIQTDTWMKILYGTKRLKHAMLRNSRAECEGDILQCRWDDCAVNTVHSHQGARKAVPAIASTHPRARGKPDYPQKLKVPEGYEKINESRNIWRGIADVLIAKAVSKPNSARKYALESSRRDLHNALLCTVLQSQTFQPNIANIFSRLNT